MAESESLETGKFYRLGKDLANTEKSVRDKAVDAIRRELKSVQNVTELEMMKLWKGLFYTFWMSDKPPVQEALATLLSDIVFDFRMDSLSWLYILCFWKTMVREWSGLDRYRIDKYCMLMRKMVNKMLLLLDSRGWKQELVDSYTSLILDVLANTDYVGPLNQFCECFLEELVDCLPHISSYDFMSLITPLATVLKTKNNVVIVNVLKNRVFESLLNDYETVREKGEKKDLPVFTDIDLRYVHSILYDITFSKNETLRGVQRRTFGELELKYEECVGDRFECVEAPKLEPPKRMEKSTQSKKPEKKEKVNKKQKKAKTKVVKP